MMLNRPVVIFVLVHSLMVGSVGWLLCADHDLDPKVNEWIEYGENIQSIDSEAFIYLLGITAKQESDVMAEGQRRLDTHHELLNSMPKVNNGDYPEFPKRNLQKSMLIPKHQDIPGCKFLEFNCITGIQENELDWQAQLRHSRILINRYRTFIQFSEFTNSTVPTPIPAIELSPVMAGGRLSLIEYILMVDKVGYQNTASMLREEIQRLRTHLALTNDAGLKVVFVSHIKDAFDVLAYLYQKNNKTNWVKIEPLSAEELSFEKLVKSEALKLINEHENFRYSHLLVKPNLMTNNMLASYEAELAVIHSPSHVFAKQAKKFRYIPKEKSLFNTVGDWLLISLPPQKIEYGASLHDLNAKILLLNHVLGGGDLKTFINPYYPQRIRAYRQHNSKVCLYSPVRAAVAPDIKCLSLLR